ncbi:hypothetical protein C5167_036909 [Papaver somniferum]|uniref:Uncharacterized protein n=1 Tax=Papaver somniferum TaxID=3469 RepID=A0A4Y7I4Z5_PAPSO|nr:hypothetical protein C5167_036909 [Papaver somniferum]
MKKRYPYERLPLHITVFVQKGKAHLPIFDAENWKFISSFYLPNGIQVTSPFYNEVFKHDTASGLMNVSECMLNSLGQSPISWDVAKEAVMPGFSQILNNAVDFLIILRSFNMRQINHFLADGKMAKDSKEAVQACVAELDSFITGKNVIISLLVASPSMSGTNI